MLKLMSYAVICSYMYIYLYSEFIIIYIYWTANSNWFISVSSEALLVGSAQNKTKSYFIRLLLK